MIIDSGILAAAGNGWLDIVNYEIIRGNALWRFGGVLLMVLVTLAAGRIVQYIINSYSARLERKTGTNALVLLLRALAKPAYVAVFAAGFFACKGLLYFNDESGIGTSVGVTWTKLANVLAAIAVAYALYRLVDVAEHFLHKVVGRTATKLDDMLVPVIRKSLRITITIVAALLIAENILDQNVKSLLLSAGVGGLAIALAAKDTIANFFGSITIFADRPFQVQVLV